MPAGLSVVGLWEDILKGESEIRSGVPTEWVVGISVNAPRSTLKDIHRYWKNELLSHKSLKVVSLRRQSSKVAMLQSLVSFASGHHLEVRGSAESICLNRRAWTALKGFRNSLFRSEKLSFDDLKLRLEGVGLASQSSINDSQTSSLESAHPVVVYTAVTGGYDLLKPVPEWLKASANFTAFLDDPSFALNFSVRERSQKLGWLPETISETDFNSLDPCRVAKRFKVLAHEYFPRAEFSLWVDGCVELLIPYSLPELVRIFLKDADICVFRHPKRDCLYEEAKAVLRQRLDTKERVHSQVQRYRTEGYPERAGLVEATVILRRHTARVKEFNEAWWQEIEEGSRRDQISFNYVARKLGMRYAEFPLSLGAPNGLFSKSEHVRGLGRVGVPISEQIFRQ